jgi:hypothetical protein
MAKFYKDKLRICPFILHANIIRFAASAEMSGGGYALTHASDERHNTVSKCIGDRCMFYEWNNVRGWCGLSTGMSEEKEEI